MISLLSALALDALLARFAPFAIVAQSADFASSTAALADGFLKFAPLHAVTLVPLEKSSSIVGGFVVEGHRRADKGGKNKDGLDTAAHLRYWKLRLKSKRQITTPY